MSKYLQIFIIIVVLCCLAEVSARGRYGGSRSGFSRSRSGSRVRSRVGSRARHSVRTRSGNMNWKTAAAAGYIAGWSSYSRRGSYHRSPDSAPQICRNEYDYKMDNGSAYSLFICPRSDQSDDMNHCCGPSDREKCCTSWEKNKAGNIAGIVIGSLVAVAIIAGVVWCCCLKNKMGASNKTPRASTSSSSSASSSFTANGAKDAVRYEAYPTNMKPELDQGSPYSMLPSDPAPPYSPQPTMGPYPPQSDATAPYPLQPSATAPYPPQPDSSAYPTAAPPPYPTNP